LCQNASKRDIQHIRPFAQSAHATIHSELTQPLVPMKRLRDSTVNVPSGDNCVSTHTLNFSFYSCRYEMQTNKPIKPIEDCGNDADTWNLFLQRLQDENGGIQPTW
jgi:hypothetical protein